MTNEPPVSFGELAKQPSRAVQIEGADLDKCFVFATVQAGDGWFEQGTGKGGHTMRTLLLPDVPSSGTYVLGVKDGTVQWIEAEDCE